jgi:hypothetical protein
MNTTTTDTGVTVNSDSLAAILAIRAARAANRGAITMCATHPSFESDYCPCCGTGHKGA